jgi:O-Antigen ligase
VTAFLFLATVFCVTFEKLHWEVAGTVSLADVLTILFLVSFAADRVATGDSNVGRTAAVVLVFGGAFLAVYLVGFFNLETTQALAQFGKGLVKFGLHFGFLAAGVAYLLRRSGAFYWRALAAFVGGMAANAAYGIVQLVLARGGINLDELILSPLTRGASRINVYGAVEGVSVYRPDALTGDPNHLGIMLLVPLLALAPVYFRLEPGHRLRVPLAALLAFLLLVLIATLSRSALLGLAVGVLILAGPFRRQILSRATLVPLALVGAILAVVVLRRSDFFETVIRSRLQTGNRATSAHFGVYDFIPDVLASNPLFGLGLNGFSVYYEFVTGKTNWGPHSFYVALLVETGLVGTVLFGLFLRYLFVKLRAGRRLPSVRVQPLAWGLTAALAGTMAANLFYLTMQFYYFYVFAAFALALPGVFARASPRGV